MRTIAKILVVVDPTMGPGLRRQHAVERGSFLARRFDAELRLLVVSDYNDYLGSFRDVDLPSLERTHGAFTATQRGMLEELAALLHADGVRASVELAWDRPLHEGITREALRCGADVVLKDTHHHAALQRALLTNTDWQLIRECPAPLLLVRGNPWAEPPKVLAAVDPLHERDKAAALDSKLLDIAAGYARAMGGELHVVHAFEPITNAAALGGHYVPVPLRVDDLNEALRLRHARALDDLVADRGLPRERVHLREGSASDELRDLARSLPASLVVMGAVARSRVRRIFIGSTAERLLESLPCDVLVVKPDGFVSPVEPLRQAALFASGAEPG